MTALTPEVINVLVTALAYVTDDTIHRIFDNVEALRHYAGGRDLIFLQNGRVYSYQKDGTKPVDNDEVVTADGKPEGGQWWRAVTVSLDDLAADADLKSPVYNIEGPAVVVTGPDGKFIIRRTTYEQEGRYMVAKLEAAYATILADKLVDNISDEALIKLCGKLPCKGSDTPDEPTNTTIESFYAGCIKVSDNSSPIIATAAEIRLWAGALPTSFFLAHPIQFGQFFLDVDNTSADDDAMTIVAPGGVRYSRVWNHAHLESRFFPGGLYNGSPTRYNANDSNGNPLVDLGDEVPINKAIDYTRLQYGQNGGTFHMPILLPAGQLWFGGKGVNCTGLNGITVTGAGNRYIGTTITGNTSGRDGSGAGVIFDFTNTSHGFLENMHIGAGTGWGKQCSKTAVLYALGDDGTGNQQNGLNCGLRNVFIGAENANLIGRSGIADANGGLGFIGVANCRTEEFTADNVNIKANTPYVFTNKANLIDAGYNYTLNSNYATVLGGTGSMGVINIGSGQNSTFVVKSYTPAFVLNGTNTFIYKGYIGHHSYDAGTCENAIQVTQSVLSMDVSATVETFATMLKARGLCENIVMNMTNSYLRVANGNLVIPTAPVYDFTDAQMHGFDIKQSFGNPITDLPAGRWLIYHAPVNDDNSPVAPGTSLINGRVTATQWFDNRFAISQNLAKATGNCEFWTGQPFSIKNGWTRSLAGYDIPYGTTGSPLSNVVARVRCGDKANLLTTNDNSGTYCIRGTICVRAGGPSSTHNAEANYNFNVLVAQSYNGARSTPSYSITPVNSVAYDANYLNVTGVNLLLSFVNSSYAGMVIPQGELTLTPVIASHTSATNEPVTVQIEYEVRCTLSKGVLIYT